VAAETWLVAFGQGGPVAACGMDGGAFTRHSASLRLDDRKYFAHDEW